jgi:ubiquinone/menaquinone biosynthesis C-methylase UbiE
MKQNTLHDIRNVEFVRGNVETLPFEDGTFDLVISRFAFHHFPSPVKVLSEMKRVAKFGGVLCIVDLISPEEDHLFERYNYFEKLRDPSHTCALKRSQFLALFQNMNLKNLESDTISVDVNVDKWLSLTCSDKKTADNIIRSLTAEIADPSRKTGMFPFYKEQELMFKHTWLKIIANK